MRVLRFVATLLSLPLACGCSPDRQSGARTAKPSKAPVAMVAPPKTAISATKKAATSKPKASGSGVAIPSGLGLGMPSGASSLGGDVNSINPVKIDAGATLSPGGIPR